MPTIAIILLASMQPVQEPVFDCVSRAGRTTVAIEHGLVVYRHRGRTGRDKVVAAAPGSDEVRRYREQYAGTLEQLRFVEGRWSYTVYGMPANRSKGSSAVSGVLVRDGRRPVADLSCRRYPPVHADMLAEPLVEDDGTWTAM